MENIRKMSSETLINAMKDFVLIVDSKYELIMFNDSFREFCDKNSITIENNMSADEFCFIDNIKIKKDIQTVFSDNKNIIREEKIMFEDEENYFEITLSPFSVLEKEIYILIILKDITKRVVQDLKDKEELNKYKTIFDENPYVIIIADIETGKMIDLNNRIEDYINMPKEKLINRTAIELGLYAKEEMGHEIRNTIKNSDSISNREIEIKLPDGSVKHAVMSTKFIEIDGKKVSLNMLNDITELVEISNNLAESEERYKALSEATQEAVIIHDRGEIVQFNEISNTLLGYDIDEDLTGINVFDFINDDCKKQLMENIERNCLEILEGEIVKRDDTLLPVEIRSYPIPYKGEDLGAIIIMDVTEITHLENKLKHSEKMQAIGQLAGGVAHDFNNTLGAIISAAELLVDRGIDKIDEERFKKSLNMILESAEYAAGLNQKLLDFARKGKAELRTMDVLKIIRQLTVILEHTIDKRIDIKADYGKCSQIYVNGDETQLLNLFLNICLNSKDAMKDKSGELKISVSSDEITETKCDINGELIREGKYAVINIKDNGCGIPQSIIHKIFEPFFTTKDYGEGTGLGLAAVYGIIKDHDGYISVNSLEGEGTNFRVYVPVCENGNKIDSEKIEKEARMHNGKILIVDDDDTIRISLRYMLEDAGYSVMVACNGEEGCDTYKKHSDEIDIIIMDLVMPVMNGMDAFRFIREFDSEAKVLISTGLNPENEAKILVNEGALGVLQKPFRVKEILGEISKHI